MKCINNLFRRDGSGRTYPEGKSGTGLASFGGRVTLVVVYDFSVPESKSFAFAPVQIPNLKKFFSWASGLDVVLVSVGAPPKEVSGLAAAHGCRLIVCGDAEKPFKKIRFSNKLHVLSLIERGELCKNSRLFLIDHDVFFLQEPRFVEIVPGDALAVKRGAYNRIEARRWLDSARDIGSTAGIPSYFLPSGHLANSDDDSISHALVRYQYYNTGVVLFPSGDTAVRFFKAWIEALEKISALDGDRPGITDCDQYAFSLTMPDLPRWLLDARHNFLALNILEGYRPFEIEAVHFAGNYGGTIDAILCSFRKDMLNVIEKVLDEGDRTYFSELAVRIFERVSDTVAGRMAKTLE